MKNNLESIRLVKQSTMQTQCEHNHLHKTQENILQIVYIPSRLHLVFGPLRIIHHS